MLAWFYHTQFILNVLLNLLTMNKFSFKNLSFPTSKDLIKAFVAVIAFGIISAATLSCKKSVSTPVRDPSLRSTTIVLTPISGNMQSGTAVFQENADHSFNVVINLTNTVKDTLMSIDIHNGSHSNMLYQAVELIGVKGTGGNATSTTSNIKEITTADYKKVPITYDGIIVYQAVINVSYSDFQDSRHVAYGDIK